MINAITLLKMNAEDLRRMAKPNANTITDYAARNNLALADEYELAAEALRKLHNEGFSEGIVEGIKSLVESLNSRRPK